MGGVLLVALAAGSIVEFVAGVAVQDRLVPRDLDRDERIVVINFAGDEVDPEHGMRSAQGFVYGLMSAIAAESGALAIGLVEFDSPAFADGGSGRAFVVGAESMGEIGIIPLLDVTIEQSVPGIPLLTDYRVDPLSSELAGIGVPIPEQAGVIRVVPAAMRVPALANGAIVHVPESEVTSSAARLRTVVPGLVVRLAELAMSTEITAVSDAAFTLGDQDVPLERGSLRVRWSDELDEAGDDAVVSHNDLAPDGADRSILDGAIVLVGSTDPAQTSFVNTPAGPLPPVLIHANALNTLLNAEYLTPGPPAVPGIAGIAAALIVIALRRTIFRVVGTLAIVVASLLIARWAASNGTLFAPLIVPVTAVATAMLLEGERQVAALNERRQLRSLFSQYVPATVADELVGARGQAARDGERVVITALFCDLRGFTRLAAQLEPSQVRVLLNTYYEEFGRLAFNAGGTVMQYTGDEIFVVFGAPVATSDHGAAAIRCARSMFDHLADLNSILAAADLPAITFGIGIHSGEVVAAHVGSSFRMQYSVIGDAVNVASRHVSAAAAGQIVISQSTVDLAEPPPDGRQVDLELKGVEGARHAFIVQAGPTSSRGSMEHSSLEQRESGSLSAIGDSAVG